MLTSPNSDRRRRRLKSLAGLCLLILELESLTWFLTFYWFVRLKKTTTLASSGTDDDDDNQCSSQNNNNNSIDLQLASGPNISYVNMKATRRAHTIGFSHYNKLSNRIFNFNQRVNARLVEHVVDMRELVPIQARLLYRTFKYTDKDQKFLDPHHTITSGLEDP
ncbi:hypothetical protein L3X38_004795 [Prunus dulcis]|uniref:Uncharacterized protein n=1 Tax=Prunus dulcis TaxID=3755 RepID=A0AAD5F3I6_PRUDU|nr:hypothetical protein L3X38_004795 [Prunus dulcis]